MKCRHGNDLTVCRLTCARCGHLCVEHRANQRGETGGEGCFRCHEQCMSFIDTNGVAVLDNGVELDVDDRQADDRRWRVDIKAWGRFAGYILLAPGREDDEVMVQRAVLKRDYRGRGIAAEVYQELARLVAPLVLTSGTETSAAAAAVWAGQVQRGNAANVGRRAAAALAAVAVPELPVYFRLERPGARPAGWPGAKDRRKDRTP